VGAESHRRLRAPALFGTLGDRKLFESISATGSVSFPAANIVNDMDMDCANAATFIVIHGPALKKGPHKIEKIAFVLRGGRSLLGF
jgi:hypothetical protein